MKEQSDYLKKFIGKKCKIFIRGVLEHRNIKGEILESENGWIKVQIKNIIRIINIDKIELITFK